MPQLARPTTPPVEETPGQSHVYGPASVRRLTDGDDESEVLAFLAERPAHTVVMSGYVRDNGLDSPFNRGSFYACRDLAGSLRGVALIGHAAFVEARDDDALAAFARLAQQKRDVHMLLGEREMVRRFWTYYATGGGQAPRTFCSELLFECRFPAEALEPVADLRQATLDDLAPIMTVHAALAFEESGVNPLEEDFEGFRLRCARRIEQGRVWVVVRDERLLFKVDVISDTPKCVYVEGLYVHPLERGRGFGARCLSQVARRLLAPGRSVAGLVNQRNLAAQSLLRRAGFEMRGHYDTVFLKREGVSHARTAL